MVSIFKNHIFAPDLESIEIHYIENNLIDLLVQRMDHLYSVWPEFAVSGERVRIRA
jgi:hypothetical protein